MSGATLLTIIMGMATNKVIAVYAGTEGIGLVGLFRNFLGFVVPVLTAGTTTVIVQMISTSSSSEEVSRIISSVFNLFIFQIIIAVIAAIFLSDYISVWLFSGSGRSAGNYTNEVRIIFAMALAVLFSQSMISIINGKVNIKIVTLINVVTASLTLIMVYPLIMLGKIGFAFIVGSGSIGGAILGFFYVKKEYKHELSKFRVSWSAIKDFTSLPISFWLLIHPLIISATFLNIQVMVNRYYGLDGLGIYAAIVMLETTTIMLLMAAMKTYYLPTLGQLSTQIEKNEFINKVLSLLIIAVFPFIIVMIFAAKYILWLLFSEDFQSGANILGMQSLAMLAQIFSWCYAMYFLHESRYRLYFIVDSVWAIFLISTIWYVASNDYPLVMVSFVYFLGSLFSLFMYVFLARRLYGKSMLNRRNSILGLAALSIIIFAYYISQEGNVSSQLAFILFLSISFIYFIVLNYKKLIRL